MNKKKKYIAVFLIKDQNSYSIEKKKRFNPSNKEITFRNKTYIINPSISTFSKGLKKFFLIDINITSGHLLFRKGKESVITPEIIDMIISKKIIHQLTSNLTDTAIKMNIMMIIIGAVIGGLIGWIAGGFA